MGSSYPSPYEVNVSHLASWPHLGIPCYYETMLRISSVAAVYSRPCLLNTLLLLSTCLYSPPPQTRTHTHIHLILPRTLPRFHHRRCSHPPPRRMAPLCDEFVKGYCLSRTMTNEGALASQDLLAKAIQGAMIVACTMMFCLRMKDEPKWKFIMDGIQIVDIDGEESDIEGGFFVSHRAHRCA